MKRQALIIGLGQFGTAVASALAQRGVEVLAIDQNEARVEDVAEFVTEAVCADATDEAQLQRFSPSSRDVAVCAIGDENQEASIIVTALLRQLGASRVVARANSDVHGRILELVGAHRVVNPEKEFGARFASQILHESVLGELPIGGGLVLTEMEAKGALVGPPLAELELPSRFGVTLVAVRNSGTGGLEMPTPSTVFDSGDVIILVGREEAVSKMLETIRS